ncbi:MAG TPA: glycoside hydrolase family 38 C-terminal domain-containing protein [Pyrinomonadaceae bacterium]|nr:glycoside hydrolase family 38 C-terminal domain-containing protein [Pyrinomonadaceae bacterium]
MRQIVRALLVWLLVCLATLNVAYAQKASGPDLTKEPTLYVVAYAHLDTQWRWQYPQVINEYLPKTMHDNFAFFEKYPHYVFNFSGANRYRMMKEYWPEDYLRLKHYVAAGRWFPSGSSMEEGDVNSPSAESIIRQILYGTQYFRHEFGKTSAEYMLPDCFGFPASLPSILAHMGLKGFSTQKLTWGSAALAGGPQSAEETPVGIPFNVGVWKGPDGNGIIAAFNPGSYGGQVREDLTKSPVIADPNNRNNPVDWPRRVQLNGKVSGLFTDYHYYGTGDTGGAPREDSVRFMEAIASRNPALVPASPAGTSVPTSVGDGPLRVVPATAEQMFLDIPADQLDRLPVYHGDLLLTNHSAGSISSQTYQKRWNRKNELLADAAEKASVAAAWLGGRTYPQERLNKAWTLVMGGQFHDILPGTATPKAFEFSWNDDVIAMNQFAGVLTSATEAITARLNTQTKGVSIVVYNPLNIAREDVVEASVDLSGSAPKAVNVFGPDGKQVPAQVVGEKDGTTQLMFLARVPSVGYAVYDVQAAESQTTSETLRVSESALENARYRIGIDANGDVSNIFDKKLDRELLTAPIRLAIKTDKPVQWPAWNMDWTDQIKAPRAYVSGPAKIRVSENGPVRVAVEVVRETEGSKFQQTIRLSAGDAGNRVEFGNVIDWKTSEANLKATFPLTAANPRATYNWDIGTVERGNNDEKKFEVPSHQWFDLTDRSGSFGVTVLSDCKYASDKPDDKTLRLTLLRTPGISPRAGYADQATQDWGHHDFVYGLAAHSGTWRTEQTDWQAQRLNQPLLAFQSDKHNGTLGKSFSILRVSDSRVRVLALKKAEESDEVIVRVVELDGKPAPNVRLSFAAPVVSAREVNGQELPVGRATIVKGDLVTNLGRFQPKTFALKLAPPQIKLSPLRSEPFKLAYDLAVATRDGEATSQGFNGQGLAMPAEMLPHQLAYDGITFELASAGQGNANALVARGQTISLPVGKFKKLYLLAAAADGDQKATFRVGDEAVNLEIENWGGFIGQWDNRQWKQTEVQVPPRTPPPGTPPDIAAQMQRPRTRIDPYGEMVSITPGFIKPAPVAWFASHRHNAKGVNEPYAYTYLFAYVIEVPRNATGLTLPNNESVRILAITGSSEQNGLRPAQELVSR